MSSRHAVAGPVLVAVTDPSTRVAISREIRGGAVSVLEAASAADAIRLCAAETPAVAIADYPLPEISGLEFANQINAISFTPIIFLSNGSDEGSVIEALNAGAFLVLAKPINVLALMPLVYAARHHAIDLRSGRDLRTRERPTEEQLRTINVVTGLLMERFRVSQSNAYGRLRQFARRQRVKIADVARDLLETYERANHILSALHEAPAGGTSTPAGTEDDSPILRGNPEA